MLAKDNWIEISKGNLPPLSRLVRIQTNDGMIKIATRELVNGTNIWNEFRKDITWKDEHLKCWCYIQ